MLDLKTEPRTLRFLTVSLLSPTCEQTEFNLWNHLLDMDKGSLPHSQPSNRSGRRATPNESPRPANRPSAQANVTPGPSSTVCRFSLTIHVFLQRKI